MAQRQLSFSRKTRLAKKNAVLLPDPTTELRRIFKIQRLL